MLLSFHLLPGPQTEQIFLGSFFDIQRAEGIPVVSSTHGIVIALSSQILSEPGNR